MNKSIKNIYLTVAEIAEMKGFSQSSLADYHLDKPDAPEPVATTKNGKRLYDPAQIAAWNPRGDNAKI